MKFNYFCWTMLVLSAMTPQILSCPPMCSCKWKGGKEAVDCGSRNLTQIPERAPEETQVLDLSSNHLVELRSEIFRNLGLINLQKLYLSKSNISEISSSAFVGLVGLVELDLSANEIVQVPSATFPSCPSLMRLILNSNPIVRVSKDAFKPLQQLTTLELSNCQLDSIEQGAFTGLQSLEWLRLNDNRLTYVPEMTLPLNGNLHGLTLHNNPWICNCRLRAMQDWLKQSSATAPQESDPVCNSPPRLHQRLIKTIKLDDLACLPEIHTEQVVDVDEGGNVTLHCNVYAIPVATVTWWINGQKCEPLKDSTLSAYVRYICKQHGQANMTNILHIYGVDKSDEGTFTCIAENTAGSAEANLSLRVRFQERSTLEPPFENTNTSYVAAVAAGALVGTLLALGCVIGGIILCAKRRRDQKRNAKVLSSQSKVTTPMAKDSDTLSSKTATDTLNYDNQQVMFTERELARTASLDRRDTVEAYRGPVPKYLTEPDLINEVYPSTNPNPNGNYGLYQHQHHQIPNRHVHDYADTRYSLQPTMDQRPSLSQIPYLDQDGYPMNFGLPKISLNCTLPRLRHRLPEGSAAAPTARYTREAEFLARSAALDTNVLARNDTRYTADGYPYSGGYQGALSPGRQPLQQIPPYVSPAEMVLPEVSEVPFIPSPPAAYKSEPTPLSPRSLMSKTAHEAAAAVAARADDVRPPDHPESPDEGYVGDAMDV